MTTQQNTKSFADIRIDEVRERFVRVKVAVDPDVWPSLQARLEGLLGGRWTVEFRADCCVVSWVYREVLMFRTACAHDALCAALDLAGQLVESLRRVDALMIPEPG
jgi:hypothetical protein